MRTITPNIGPRQRRRRLALGVIGLIAAAATIAVIATVDAPRAARALIALPLYAAALGFFQHREKT